MADERLAIDRLMHVTEKFDPYIKREKLMQSVAEECARICDGSISAVGCSACARIIREQFRLGGKT